eukprot:Phypoly_transcript_02435.p1 GENE.Phypoly_transcript_02435~~Phypoly_transcript_02435.p1  ORF type:complete len:884 (+),score=75.70 Phypoly_transcript_02435:120-2771(+)
MSVVQPLNESLLYRVLKDIFPGEIVQQNVRKELNVVYPTGGYMEFDMWIPKYDLCFEFQDSHHYTTTWYYQATKTQIQKKDKTKKEAAQKLGMTLVHVPYWWDGSQLGVVSSIVFLRPDINIDCEAYPIPLNPPKGFTGGAVIPNVGEFMLASLPDNNFNAQLTEFSWWIGEKYDGVRCCWNPLQHKLYLRSGSEAPVKPELNAWQPAVFTDTEIWFGRGEFARTYDLHTENMCDWTMLRMISFDVPSLADQKSSYEDRYAKLLENLPVDHPFIFVALRIYCTFWLQSWFVQCIIDSGGEGIILQRCGSFYEPGRSPSLIKLKTTAGEQEAIVVGIGKRKSIALKLANGVMFTVPQENVFIELPSPGDIVTFSYEAFARRDVPVNPTIFRIRTDLAWDDLVERATRSKKYLNETSEVKELNTLVQGQWTLRTMRQYMENFARGRNMDPLEPKTWYMSFRQFISSINGKAILRKFKHGYFQALYELFPEVRFDLNLFRQSYYKVENRRSFFEKYAAANSFNPLKPENWYNQAKDKLMSIKGAARVISYHKNSVIQALIDLFPNITFDRSKFQFRQNIWHNVDNRRQFFYDYARRHNFSPLQLSNWYSQPREKIMATKGADRVLAYHKNSVSAALLDLFPNIEVASNNSPPAKSGNKRPQLTEEQRRNFFVTYAKMHNFDPYDPDIWHSQPISRILATEGAADVIYYHNQSVSKALLDLFPNIGLDIVQFRYNTWHAPENRRKFMEKYARKKGFDPLVAAHWYIQSPRKFLASRGADRILTYYKNSLSTALIELFPNIGLEKTKFKYKQNMWGDKANRRKFFETFAAERKFDPLSREEWYKIPITRIYSRRGGSRVLFYHGRSLAQALLDLFPEIGLERSKILGK